MLNSIFAIYCSQVHQVIQAIQLVVIHPLLGCRSMGVQESSGLRVVAAKVIIYLVVHPLSVQLLSGSL